MPAVHDADGADDLLYGMLVIGTLVGLVAAQQLYLFHLRLVARKRAVRLSLQRSYCCGSVVRTRKRAVLACAEMMASFDARKGSPTSPAHAHVRRRGSSRRPSLEPVCEDDGPALTEWPSCAREDSSSTSEEYDVADEPPPLGPDSPRSMPHVVVLGERHVAAQATGRRVIDTMVALASKHGVELHVHEGLPHGLDEMDALCSQIGAALMIWDAAMGAPLAEAFGQYIEQLKTKTLPAVLTLVLRKDKVEDDAGLLHVQHADKPLEQRPGSRSLWCVLERCCSPPRRSSRSKPVAQPRRSIDGEAVQLRVSCTPSTASLADAPSRTTVGELAESESATSQDVLCVPLSATSR